MRKAFEFRQRNLKRLSIPNQLAQGLAPSDECFVANNFPYRYLESAIGAITGAYLTQAATDSIPDYI
jgi:hypothetical protein